LFGAIVISDIVILIDFREACIENVIGLGLPDVSDHFLIFFLFQFTDVQVFKYGGGGFVISAWGCKGEIWIKVLLDDIKESVIYGLDIENVISSFADEFVVKSEDLIEWGVIEVIFMVFGCGHWGFAGSSGGERCLRLTGLFFHRMKWL
jgi:hypothetical protein